MDQDKNLQLEHGNYTQIVNRVLDELVKLPLLGTEYAICFFIIRKTWGYKKSEDDISLTQFQEATGRSRPTVIKALKNLILVNMVLLVRPGSPKNLLAARYKFNKYYSKWQKELISDLVKERRKPSKATGKNLVKPSLHTKEKQNKDNKRKRGTAAPPVHSPSNTAKSFFKGVKDAMDRVESLEKSHVMVFFNSLIEKYPTADKKIIWDEMKKFYLYWTELNASGTKQRWQKETTFQVDRRLQTWFDRVDRFPKPKTYQNNKGRGLVE